VKLSRPPRDWERRTSIIATLGPATSSSDILRTLIETGVDVVRLNFSHGTPDSHAGTYKLVRDMERTLGRSVAVLQDLAGPKVRIGPLPHGSVELKEGALVTISRDSHAGSDHAIPVTYSGLAGDVRKGDRILLDDGSLELAVEATGRAGVRARVVRGGVLLEHKGLNVPGVTLRVPALTEKDLADLALGIKLGAPEKTVIATVGDGAYIFGAPTAAHFVARAQDLPVLFVVFNNRAWNAVKRSVRSHAPQGWAARTGLMPLSDLDPAPDYELVCQANGGYGERVEDPAALPGALERALRAVRQERRQALLNVICKKPA